MLCQSKRHTAVSNHETHYCIKARRRCCDTHGRRQTLLLCHSTTHQTVRALPMVAFALRGGGGLLREYISLRCALGSGRSVRAKIKPARLSRTSQNTIHRCCVKHETTLLWILLCQSKGQTAESKHETHAGSNQQIHCCDQSTGHMLCQSKRHTAVLNHETHYCIKARRRCCDAHGRRQTLLLCHSTTHQTVRALPSIEHRMQ